jgi:hypothetical protein
MHSVKFHCEYTAGMGFAQANGRISPSKFSNLAEFMAQHEIVIFLSLIRTGSSHMSAVANQTWV